MDETYDIMLMMSVLTIMTIMMILIMILMMILTMRLMMILITILMMILMMEGAGTCISYKFPQLSFGNLYNIQVPETELRELV